MALAEAQRIQTVCYGEYAKVKAVNPNANDAAAAVQKACMADRGIIWVR